MGMIEEMNRSHRELADWIASRGSSSPSGYVPSTIIDNGQLLQDSQGNRFAPAAIAKAALLPINDPTQARQEQVANWTQGLANNFDARSAERSPDDLSPDKIIKNPNFNMLYAADPQKANRVYRQLHPEGKTFDEAFKDQQDQKTFIKKTIQEHIASNRLRQGVTGDWEEMQELPDPVDSSKTIKAWGPAHPQTRALLESVGGGRGIYGQDFSNPTLQVLDKRLMQLGITDPEQRKAKIQQMGLVKPTSTQPTVAPVLNNDKTAVPMSSTNLSTPFGDVDPVQAVGQWWNKPTPRVGQYPMDTPVIGPQTKSKEELLRMLFTQ